MPNTFMAVALDLPDDVIPPGPLASLHPRDKQDVGKRLSMAAFHYVYGLDFSGSGPVIQSVVQSDESHVIVNYPMGEELVVQERKNFEVSDVANLNLVDYCGFSNNLDCPVKKNRVLSFNPYDFWGFFYNANVFIVAMVTDIVVK